MDNPSLYPQAQKPSLWIKLGPGGYPQDFLLRRIDFFKFKVKVKTELARMKFLMRFAQQAGRKTEKFEQNGVRFSSPMPFRLDLRPLGDVFSQNG